MSKWEGVLKRFLDDPAGLPYRKIEKLLLRLGFKREKLKGSHQKFIHPNLGEILIVPVHGGDCKKFYKNEIVKFIKKYFYE